MPCLGNEVPAYKLYTSTGLTRCWVSYRLLLNPYVSLASGLRGVTDASTAVTVRPSSHREPTPVLVPGVPASGGEGAVARHLAVGPNR